MTNDVEALLDGPARDLAVAVTNGDVALTEILDRTEERLARAPAGTFVTTEVAVARREASALEERLVRGERPVLAGVIAAHKDLLDTADFETTYGHPALARRPDRDAVAVSRARSAGVLQIGKANLHEVAFGVTGDNPHTGSTAHPTHQEHVPGGSSSGSATAVACAAVGVSLGTDTGGSVRIPAACCGIVGVKPTRGAVPTTGVLPLSWLQDTVGVLARSVQDAALLLAAVAGPDDEDPVARPSPPDWLRQRPSGPHDAPHGPLALRRAKPNLYVPSELWDTRVDPQIRSSARAAVDRLADEGARVVDIDLPRFEEARRAQATLLGAHALAVHAEHVRDHPETFGEDVRARLERARDIDGAAVAAALRVRQHWLADLGDLLERGDAIACPTVAMPAPRRDAAAISWPDGDEPVTPALTRLTGIWNLAGLPAVSVPCGLVGDGLPAGLQLVGRPWSEPSLLALAASVECKAA